MEIYGYIRIGSSVCGYGWMVGWGSERAERSAIGVFRMHGEISTQPNRY